MARDRVTDAEATPKGPSAAEGLAVLRAVESSALFAQSARHRKFLRHLMECWAKGDLAQLREISLGVVVFGRATATFDPAHDSIVRVEARRLRARLARYYADVGSADPVRITLAPGSYVPSVSYSGDYPGASAAASSDTRVVLWSAEDKSLQPIGAELQRFMAGVRGIHSTYEFGGRRTVADGGYAFEIVRASAAAPEGDNAWLSLRPVPADGQDRSARSATALALLDLTASRRSVIGLGRALGYSLLTAGLEIGWCQLTPGGGTGEPPNIPVRDRLQQAQLAFRQRSIAGYQSALRLYETLLQSGADGADVEAGLARCCVSLAGMLAMPVREAMPRARAHAERALAFDPECADARCVLAQVAMLHDRHWQQSLHHYLQGIQRSPRHAPLHHAFAFAVMCQGDFDLAERAFQTAISLDPLDLQVRIQRWLVPHYRGDYDAAIGGWEELLAATPEHLLAITLVGAAHLAAGRPEMAISRYQIACDRQPQHPIGHAGLAQSFAMLGDVAAARRHLNQLNDMARRSYVSPYLYAMIQCRLGDQASTYHWLRRSAEEPDFNFVCAAVDPTFAALRAGPEWSRFCAETGLPALPGP